MIYVDDMNIKFGRLTLSHMWSDSSLDELHSMADAIGVKRKWFQNKQRNAQAKLRPLPHYDVSLGMKDKAIKLGAKLLVYGCEEWLETVRKGRQLSDEAYI